MINKRAIEAFLKRKLNSYDWLKTSGDALLDCDLRAMDPVPDFNGIKPWQHQKACFLLLNELDRFIFHINMGGGKTLLSLMFLKYKKQCGQKPRAIVFVPYITSVETWVEQVAEHMPDLRCVACTGTTQENLAHLEGPGDLFVICYQSAVAAVTEKGKSRWNFEAKDIRDYFGGLGFNMMICDEIHRTKSASSLSYRMCRAISTQCKWVIGLTGTPFGKNIEDIWPQFYLIDFGETLGPTLEFFKAVFFKRKKHYFKRFDFQFDKKLMPQLSSIIKNRSIHYGIDEFYDMPPKEYIRQHFRMPFDLKEYAKRAKAEMRQGVKDGDYRLVESNYLILRQISSGFMTFKGADDDRLQVRFDENPKLEALVDLIEQMPPQCKMVVFHHFVYTNQLISDTLKQMKVKHARIYGKVRDPIEQLRRFKNDDKCRVLVINSKSGSSSLNLQGANYIVFFEQPDSPIDRQQAEARCWRPGQQRRVFIYDLMVNGTADLKMLEANQAGTNLLKALLKGDEEL